MTDYNPFKCETILSDPLLLHRVLKSGIILEGYSLVAMYNYLALNRMFPKDIHSIKSKNPVQAARNWADNMKRKQRILQRFRHEQTN